MFNLNFADDWIRTADLWNRKRPLYQLSHNHFPAFRKLNPLKCNLGNMLTGNGCGSVVKTVASDSRGPRVESSHPKSLLTYLLLTAEKTKIKEKQRPGIAHFWLALGELKGTLFIQYFDILLPALKNFPTA